MNKKFGAKKQPNVPNVMQDMPISKSFRWLNLTLNRPSSDPETTAATLEIVTNWLTVASDNGSEDPKNVNAKSIRNMPVRDSIIHVEKKAMVKDGTKRFPAVDFLVSSLIIPTSSKIFFNAQLDSAKDIITHTE